ncbi:hypothetical protein [Nocardioides currus]|uniref:Glycosyltransferase RgtA/B/C/D-like domain-containing protein n=1 Tax=Nocardioides currus TaxID=2133958 RepID=A0A2R7YW68_9ACTN|nr:hypothetical protein [Nocardioides currus]PUA80618.1 hypothetical protein C7S10_12730 [Nocardioides currus]
MTQHGPGAPEDLDRSWGAVGVSLLTAAFVLALLALVGADLLWLVALGDDVRRTGSVPDGVPFAVAPSDGWPPVLLVAEVVLSVLHGPGLSALLLWHFLTVLATLAVVAVDARRRGASDRSTALALGALLLGGISVFAVVRLQTFSLLPFALVLLLVRSQHVRPGRGIWWAPVLVAVWGNLHGSVLLGVCVVGAYLLLSRLSRRPAETILVGLATLAALFVNPATWRTGEYYLGVMQNEAAAQGEGLWAAPNLSDPFDLLMIAAAVVLGAFALRRRLPLWEYVALAGLLVATVVAARNGIWLLLLLTAPAAAGRAPSRTATPGDPDVPPALGRPSARATVVCLVGAVAAGALLLQRTHALSEDDERFAAQVAQAAPGQVVLAPEPVVESLAVHGTKVWLSNPLDAFEPADQRAYLDFMAGRPGMATAVAASGAVLVREGSAADERMAGLSDFDVTELDGSWLIYVRT